MTKSYDLSPCATCRHPRSRHEDGGKCDVKPFFIDRQGPDGLCRCAEFVALVPV